MSKKFLGRKKDHPLSSMPGSGLLKLLLLFMVLFLLPAGCTPDDELTEQEAEIAPIRMAYLHNDLHQLAFYVARQKGFYEEAGVEVEIAGAYSSGVELMAAFQAGAIDAGYVGFAPATVAVANGKAQVKAVALANQAGSAIVVNKDLDLETVRELEGCKVAVPNIGTVQDFLLNRALEEKGYPGMAVEKAIMSPPEMISAMETGGIDACVVWEPYVSQLVEEGNGEVLIHSGDIWENHPCCVLVVEENMLEERPEAVKALVQAHIRATSYILQHEEESLEMAVSFTGLAPDIVKASMENIVFSYALDAGEAEIYAHYLVEQGLVELDQPGEFISSFIDDSFLEEGGN